jgi:type II secretory ATPase GspE/PulE/Tfp pilus assembly ATPase PilB-like protein
VRSAIRETAEIAIRAALTGHLVFSTVHTNDSAVDGDPTCIDIGRRALPGVQSSLLLVVAQRLAPHDLPATAKS